METNRDHPAKVSNLVLINVLMPRALAVLNTLLAEGRRLHNRQLFPRFILCLEFELIIISWHIACHVTTWGWKDLQLPSAFCHLVQVTRLGLLDDELVVEGLSHRLASTLPPVVSDPPRAWWINFPERESEAPRSQDDKDHFQQLYPTEVCGTTYLHAPPPPPAGTPSRGPPDILPTGRGNLARSKVEAEKLLEMVESHFQRGKIRSNQLDFRLRRLCELTT
ncbi:hypothetical protein CC1G_15159 [Coprinopsis cinerea okayama7|uniref:Uncharacterized protein n=1 Tax=Coprinopsis cinerea (strain Okayama-7 / 130 / ATCC MYA-4618 / FGSC 9003) TaxID=240176 RepID=D6RPS6_COPC7|nr:hypothetical protein CC1G_15159 [Coprinopsis cinerea okayama7\|eukprot:XP_002910520.1 hypothetical protein CC1G_15159 [Coprinopsis cinerea okayama7\